MLYKIIEITTPHRCCAICGTSWSDYLKDKTIECQDMYRAHYYKHEWVWWEPYKRDEWIASEDKPSPDE